jgi:hypothetical protein
MRALAWFRGAEQVALDDLRQLLPWVLQHKLQPNPTSPFFHSADHAGLLGDRISWIHQLFEQAVAQFAAYRPLRVSLQDLRERVEARLRNRDLPALQKLRQELRVQLEDLAGL